MVVRDRQENIIAKVYRSRNHLYTVELEITRPVCLTAMDSEDVWRWHARYGHLNFEALRKLAQDGMVRGMPLVEHAD